MRFKNRKIILCHVEFALFKIFRRLRRQFLPILRDFALKISYSV